MQPSAQGIASLFMGNPDALAARVDQDRKSSPMGIPDDLRQLMALNIVTTEDDAAKRQQAMSQLQQMAPNGKPPTVADNVRQQAAQKLQARMVQEQQKQQAMQQMLAGLPAAGVPANVPQPQGIDQAPVEFGMAGGGIVSFQAGDVVLDPEETREKEESIDYFKDPIGAARQAAEQESRRYRQEIPAPDRAVRDRLMAELERQKAGTASPTGMAGLLEFFNQIATSARPGRSSLQAAAAGLTGAQGLEATRQATRGAIIEKQLRLEQEQYDANRQYAKDVFGVKTSEFDRLVRSYTALFKEKGEDDRLAKRHANDMALEEVKQKGRIELEKDKQAAEERLENLKQKGRMAASAAERTSPDERVAARAERISTGKETFNGESGPEAADKYIESISKSAAARMGARYTGPDKTFEREVKLQQLYATDPQLKSFADALALAEMGNQPERVKRLRDAINARKAELSATMPAVPGRPTTPTAPAGAKVMTMADVKATAQKHGKTEAEVIAAAKAKGFTINP